MIYRGKSHRLGDDINTDYIIAAKYRALGLNFKEMAKHLFEDLDPTIVSRIKNGDFIVAGRNFGCGSSREFAPIVIKEAGSRAVLAKSYARIFYRNAINVGLTLLECETEGIMEGDEIELDTDRWVVKNLTRKTDIRINPMPSFMSQMLKDGGLVPHFKKWGGFHLSA
jgi:3-isopropylmalate/(R)-2-methylmalate dehydratase small subunit